MSDLPEKEFRTVIEDARARHTAVIGLLYFTDTQAMLLLRLYVTLGIATVSGSAAGFSSSQFVSRPVAWALVTASLLFVLGSSICLWALRGVVINLPGRKADFWKWAIRDDVDRQQILAAYLDNLEGKNEINDKANRNSAGALSWAKVCGALAPLIALIVGAAAAHFKF